ncbi:MAG: carboxypeptidase regulatory-like domain-containing protein [Clostridia bacterium]|nr:carboxypeptidase regulatory-like domain-containing protein [Clostridia bacterium]
MFFYKKTGSLYKNAKLAICAVLAICVMAASFVSIPFITSAKDPDAEIVADTRTAVFIGKVGGSAVANAFIPVDIANGAGDGNLYSGETYFKLTFECRMLSGTKPVIGIMRVSNTDSGKDCTYSEPSWCDNAKDVSLSDGICTAYFKVDFKNRFNEGGFGWRSFYITVGNAEHDGGSVSESDFDASFIMSGARLVTCDKERNVTDETNRLPEFTPENINFGGTYFYRSNGCSQWDSPYGASAMQWHVDSSPAVVREITVPANFNVSSDYEAANFVKHGETDALREYYTNEKYSGIYFEMLKNSADKGFAVISGDLNKKFVFIEANHQGEEDNTTIDGYKPTKNKVGNIFLPITLGQYVLTGGATTNQKVLLKVTFKATRIEGDGPPVLGRLVGMKTTTEGKGSRAWGLSTVNARGSEYYTNYDRSDNGGGVRPQCTYDPETGEFVGWVGMETGNNDLATCWGIHEVLTIGNAEHVYQTGTFDSTSFNSSFAISNIKVDLYSTTISGNKIDPKDLIAEDIAPALTADTVDTEGEWYYDHKDSIKGSNHDKDLIRASQNAWHIDGEKSLVSILDMADIAAYAPKCSVHIKDAAGVISAGVSLEPAKAYGFVFKNKYESGAKAKPFVEFNTSSGAVKLDTSNYLSNTGEFYNSSIVFKTPADLIEGKNVRLGVDIVSADVDGVFGAFELFEIGEDGMMITDNDLLRKIYIKSDTVLEKYTGNEDIGVWTIDGTLGAAGTTLDILLRENSYYLLPGTPNMLMFAGKNTTANGDILQVGYENCKLTQSLRIEKDKRYRFSANIKYASTGMEGDKHGILLTYINKAGSVKTLSDYTDLSDSGKYLMKYEFDSPKSLLASGSNFEVTLSVPNGLVSGYLANVRFEEIDASGNVISDNLIAGGSFLDGDYTGWEKSGSFYIFKFCEIPENFFSTDPAHKIHALEYRDTADYELLQQMMFVKADTRYELSYTSLVTGKTTSAPYGVVYQTVYNKDKTDSSWSYLQDNELNPALTDFQVNTTKTVLNEKALKAVQGEDDYDSSEVKDHAIRVTKTFRTSEDLRMSKDNNLSIRFNMMSGSAGYISDYQLYELDENGNRIGNNLIIDGDFSSGFEVFSKNPGNNATPWNHSNAGYIRNIEIENGYFENYSVPAEVIRSDGAAANVTYGNQLFVDPASRYYLSGYTVKTNFTGVTPEVLYRSVSNDGDYKLIPIDLYFNSSSYYFETGDGFIIPDDAVINGSGKADIIVRMNNYDYGKGYFSSITLTKDGSNKNLFDDSKAQLNQFKKIKYDQEIFTPFEGDEKFEDGDWSGENPEKITTGSIAGRVYDGSGLTASGIKIKLMPGNITTVTDAGGVYGFDKLTPGDYSVYLVEASGNALFCYSLTVKESVLTSIPDIYYTIDTDDGEGDVDIDDSNTPAPKNYGAIKGYCYDSSGKLLSGIDIYVNSKAHHAKTDAKGMFEFDKVPPGEYKLLTVLEDGSAYVFKTVKVEAGKGVTVKVMMPDPENSGLPLWAIIAIIAGGAVIVLAGAFVTVLLILKSKKKKKNKKTV